MICYYHSFNIRLADFGRMSSIQQKRYTNDLRTSYHVQATSYELYTSHQLYTRYELQATISMYVLVRKAYVTGR